MDKRFQAFDAWELQEIMSGLGQQAYYMTGDEPIKQLLKDCSEMYHIKEQARIDALPKCETCGKIK